MDARLYLDEAYGPSSVSTGHLPAAELVKTLLNEGHERFKSVNEGKVADYIPSLAGTPRDLFRRIIISLWRAVISSHKSTIISVL